MNLPLVQISRGWRQRLGGALAAAVIVLALAGCRTEESKQKWLNFFFDGVPRPGATNAAAVSPVRSSATNAPVVTPPPANLIQNLIHAPYAKRDCTACHESAFSQNMKGRPGEVCFNCHTAVQTNFLAAKFKHQPMENGECTSCHQPHSSPNKKLLIQPGEKLCYECHDTFQKDLAAAKVKHQPVENGDCLACHDPHAANQKKLVRKSVPGLCWDCHDNFLTGAKFSHTPVEDCAGCHNVHQAGEPKLLLKPAGRLCFECHDEKDLAALKAHAGTAAKSCTDCHDPHVGGNKALLKPAAAAKPEAAPAK